MGPRLNQGKTWTVEYQSPGRDETQQLELDHEGVDAVIVRLAELPS